VTPGLQSPAAPDPDRVPRAREQNDPGKSDTLMSDRAIDTYLNDHLAGAMLGADLAKQIRQRNEGTPLGELMGSIAPQIEEDRQILVDLMERMNTSKNPLKQAAGWVAEKASRVKFSGASSGAPDYGTFMALETLTLGVLGKAKMWKVLKNVQSQYPPLASTNLDELIERADTQHGALERERLAAGALALGHSGDQAPPAPAAPISERGSGGG
jgi:hypothetical protein